jgi:ribonuclease HI
VNASLKTVVVYTDGACSGNPGPGGWAAVISYNGHERELSGGERTTTNNRMELQAAIAALQKLNEPCAVHLHTDSKYVVQAFNERWIAGWQRRGWMTSAKKPVANRDLWEQLIELTAVHQVEWNWVRGHSDDALNERCDRLAVAQRDRHRAA